MGLNINLTKLENYYNENIDDFKETEVQINSFEELKSYIIDMILTNLQYDFYIPYDILSNMIEESEEFI